VLLLNFAAAGVTAMEGIQDMVQPLTGRIALVTGASSVIGYAGARLDGGPVVDPQDRSSYEFSRPAQGKSLTSCA